MQDELVCLHGGASYDYSIVEESRQPEWYLRLQAALCFSMNMITYGGVTHEVQLFEISGNYSAQNPAVLRRQVAAI